MMAYTIFTETTVTTYATEEEWRDYYADLFERDYFAL